MEQLPGTPFFPERREMPARVPAYPFPDCIINLARHNVERKHATVKNPMTKSFLTLLTLALTVISAQAQFENPDQYNIKWHSPSSNSGQSMPCGGRDTGLNVWVENGDILFYMQRSGSYDANGQCLKLGRVRVSFSPNPFASPDAFLQELKLKQGRVEISARKQFIDHGEVTAKVLIWVDTEDSTIHFTSEASEKTTMRVRYESWRHEDREFTDKDGYGESFAIFGTGGKPGKYFRKKDTFEVQRGDDGDSMYFYHKNPDESVIGLYIQQQGLEKYRKQIHDNLANRISGGQLMGGNLEYKGEQTGQYQKNGSKKTKLPVYKAFVFASRDAEKSHAIRIGTHISRTGDVAAWKAGLEKRALAAESKQRSEKWWGAFWDKSRIVINPMTGEQNTPWRVGRNYQLFRYMLGCNYAGETPTKFNGGNFTVDPFVSINGDVYKDSDTTGKDYDADWRAWGGHVYTAQNQRLVYWPLLKSGDGAAIRPQLDLFKLGLGGAQARCREHFGHDGAVYCEYTNAAGLAIASGWGWDADKDFMPDSRFGWKADKSWNGWRKRGPEVPFGDPRADATKSYGEPVEKGVMANGAIAYHWESQVEHAYMALLYRKYTGADIGEYLPFIKASLVFFDQHYQKREKLRGGSGLDNNGKIVFFPSTACESYRGAKNPSDLVSGIRSCLNELLAQELYVDATEKSYLEGYLTRLPEVSFGKAKNGDAIVLPAETWKFYQNVECPQFYPLFPFNRYNLVEHDMTPFKNAWKHGDFPKNMYWSWHQDAIFYARMGMTQEAADFTVKKLDNSNRRFPAFWGPGHDWVPDHNWGGSGMIGLQEMLMQTFDRKIVLFPAWPKHWDVDFKLHAPYQTVVEGKLVNGKVENLRVTPASRQADIVNLLK
ncbi:MAG: hypothetical protein H7A51_02495 [Akkermansiaceae bacterium]|nr:hypothetical protein [Akkermansiaceae bacterium]